MDDLNLLELSASLDELRELLENNTLGGTGLSGGSHVIISDDRMEVWLYLAPPEEDRHYLTEELVGMLQAEGVTKGIKMSRLVAMAQKGIYDRKILVATGKEVVPGEDGHYEYYFSPEEGCSAPTILPDGSVDYSSMGKLESVKEGDKIATYFPGTIGEDGYTVDGIPIPAKKARELPPLRGMNIRREGDSYFATVAGRIEARGDYIDIKTVHEIPGDVDLTTGRVEFFGDIAIGGNVGTGVVIRAGRNLTIEGVVENAVLYAGGDIIMKRGVQGNMKGKVHARGSVFANFIEQCTVEADGNVEANYMLNATVKAKQKVIVNGGKGSIIGGSVHGLKGVQAGNLGNDIGVKTLVGAGYDRQLFIKYSKCLEMEKLLKSKLEDVLYKMEVQLKRLQINGMSASQELLELNKKKEEFFKQIDELTQQSKLIQTQIEEGKGVRIYAEANVYLGVILEIESVRRPISDETRHMYFHVSKGMIVAEPIRGVGRR